MATPFGTEYYAGKNLLITGATGFVGKVLLEAILRKLPEVGKVSILIRSRIDKSGRRTSPAETLQKEVFASSAFAFLRERHGSRFDTFVLERVEAVGGDIGEERLGLSSTDYERLRAETDLVINSAALAVFDAPLDGAVRTNTLGPRRLLEFAREAPRRPFLAHISTCYVNNVGGPVFETALDPRMTPKGPDGSEAFDVDQEVKDVQKRVEEIYRISKGGPPAKRRDPPVERRLVAEGLRWARRRGWKDTYTFTKAMGEQQLVRHQNGVPMLILRPSVIESALATPAPGWIDGFRMMDPLIVGFGRGQLPEFPGNPESVLDLVPVDRVVNALLMAIPWTHLGGGPLVYQTASGMENPLLLKELRDYLTEHFAAAPLRRGENGSAPRLPHLTFPEVRRFLRHLDWRYLWPLRVCEKLCSPLRVVPWGRRVHADLVSQCNRIVRFRNTASIYGPYGETQSRFLTFNLRELWRRTEARDREMFPFLLRGVNWKHYLQKVHVPGIERYLLRNRRSLASPAALVENGEDASGALAAFPVEARRDLKNGFGRAKWRKAERLLALTREVRQSEVEKWTTPVYTKWVQRGSGQLISLICRKRLELECIGREHIPERGPFIVVANHTSHIDTGILLTAIGEHARTAHPTAAADYWFRSRFVAWLLYTTLGGIPFDRHATNVPRALALPAQVLRNGHCLIFYPEGTRSPDGGMHPFKSTVGLLALSSGAPILPAYISGATGALPRGESRIRHHPVRVEFGRRIATEPYLGLLDRESVASVARLLAKDVESAVRGVTRVDELAEIRLERSRVAG